VKSIVAVRFFLDTCISSKTSTYSWPYISSYPSEYLWASDTCG